MLIILYCYDTIPPVQLETAGGVLSTMDMVVQLCNGPHRLCNDDEPSSIVLLSLAERGPDLANRSRTVPLISCCAA